jgi:hypothetical protein
VEASDAAATSRRLARTSRHIALLFLPDCEGFGEGAVMRLFRRRRKFGRQVVKVEVDPGKVDALIDRGYPQRKDRDERELLAAAVTAHFSDAKVPYSAKTTARHMQTSTHRGHGEIGEPK